MENIKVFNNELFSLYDQKPPISKAKMAAITKSAMKAIKFYKHVVQSVEKFILKCKSEYKIPGLYVIDSIVRQSRHQFGPEKDLFAPRFARNIQITFANLFSCPVEEKSRIIRVLNLWQKNCVFAPEVIQPLFDLANPDHPIHQQISSQQANQDNNSFSNGMNISHDSPGKDDASLLTNPNISELALPSSSNNQLDTNTIRQLQQFQQLLMRQTNSDASQDQVKFNKKLLDYDYDDEDDEDKNKSPKMLNIPDPNNIAQILSDPNVLKQLQNLQKLKQSELEEKQSKLSEMRKQEEKFEKHLATVLKKLPFASECDLSRTNMTSELHQSGQNVMYQSSVTAYNTMMQVQPSQIAKEGKDGDDYPTNDGKVEVINLDANDSRSPSPGRDRYKRRRSRSRSRDRRGERSRRRSRSNSLSRSPRRRRSSRDRKDREQERERRKRGLPEMKKDHLSVCSTTLWVGHLSKLVQQEELSDTFGKYGEIVSIDMIPPRGCAFIVMDRRQDAFKSMQSLKGYKMQGRAITISWAAGKGVKSKEWKDYWDIDLGVSYIPYEKINPTTNFESLEEGGMLDEDTMPQWLKDQLNASKQFKIDGIQPAPLFNLDISQPPPTSGAVVNPLIPGFPNIRLGLPYGFNMNAPPPSLAAAAAVAQTNNLISSNFNLLGGSLPMPPPPIINQMGASVPTPLMAVSLNDDKMDLETDEEHNNAKPGEGIFFNHPPPKIDSVDRTFDKKSRPRDDSRDRMDNRRDRDRNRTSRYNRGDSRDREMGYGNRDRREKSFDRMRDGGMGRNNRDNRRQQDNDPFMNQPSGFRDNSRRHNDSGLMFDDMRGSRQDFKRGDDRRPYSQARFPGPGGPRGGRGGPPLNFAPRGGGPMFRGGRAQGFRFNNDRPNFGDHPNHDEGRDRSSYNRDNNRKQFNRSRTDEDDAFADFEETIDNNKSWNNSADKNNKNARNLKSDNEFEGKDISKQEEHTDMFEDKPETKPISRPIYEDKGPPGEDGHMDTSLDLKPPSPPKIVEITSKSQTEKPTDTTFGNTTPLFDEPQETTVERKDEESSNQVSVGDEQ